MSRAQRLIQNRRASQRVNERLRENKFHWTYEENEAFEKVKESYRLNPKFVTVEQFRLLLFFVSSSLF